MQPYPTGTQMPEVQRPPIPPQVSNAIKTMYAGAVATIVGIVIEILTVGATKTAIENGPRHLTASQVNVAEHALIIGFAVSGLVAVAAWIILARACQNGHNWARMTGTALFVLATVDALVASRSPVAVAVKAWWPVIWVAGLVTVIFLWQRASTAFFKGTSE
jgi:hypothetical protein